jgi:multidrug efflux pump subunit AcrB
VPLGTLGHLRNDLEYGVIWERDRQPTITVQSDVAPGAQGIDVTHAVDKALAGITTLTEAYKLQGGGH